MQIQQELTSIKKTNRHFDHHDFMSPAPRNALQQQIHQLQLLSQQEVVQKLKSKKQQIINQSQQILSNCHQYFMDLTSVLIQAENNIKKSIDKQTLSYLQDVERKISEVRQNQHSYNCNSQVYQTLKLLLKNFTQTQENVEQIRKFIDKCYTVNLQGFTEQCSEIGMSTNKIYISHSEFITTNKKIHGNLFQVSERQFQLTLAKFQQKQQKYMLLNQRLKTKLKSLEQMLSKKGLNIKELNRMTTAQNQKCSQDYWDLQLQRVKGQNSILTEEITLISNKLIALTSQNQGLKGEYKKMVQSNISQISNQNNTINQGYQIGVNLEDHSRVDSQNFMPSQTLISNTIRDSKEEEIVSGIYLQSNIQNQILVEYEKKNQQLSLQLHKRLRELQELRQQINSNQKTIQQLKSQNEQKQQELQRLSHHCSTLQHDYEVSSKKRFELEEKINILKEQVKQFQEKENYLNIQSKLQIDNLESLLKIKQQTLTNLTQQLQYKIKLQYDSKIQQLNQLNSQLQQQLQTHKAQLASNKSSSQTKLQRFKDQFKKLQKSITSKDQELAALRQELYQSNQLQNQTQQLKKEQNTLTFKQKYQNTKKELNRIKKDLKDKIKQYQNLKSQNSKISQLLAIKCPQINNKLQSIVNDMQKVKNLYQSKLKILQQKSKLIKQKHQFNLIQLANQYQFQGKKSNLIQTIQKYTEAMNNFSQKNAQIKKLKQENKQLKSNKTNNSKTIKITKDIQLISKHLENSHQQITLIERTLIQDRAKIQKGILQEKISILTQEKQLLTDKLNAKQTEMRLTDQELNKTRREVKKNEQLMKKQSNQQQLKTQINSLQQKILKLQSQLKSSKNLYKKSQQQLTAIQNQLKKKKDHISNVKKQLTSHSDQLQQLNFIIKNKNEQIQKLKRQLKDQSTKQTLLNQMKQRMEEYQQLQILNQQLKKQIDKINTQSKFQINKLQNQLKQLKTQKRQEITQRIHTKTTQLNDQLTDLKNKHKKLKSQLERKDTLTQHLKSKSDAQINQLKLELEQTIKQLTKKIRQSQNYEKKIEIITINQRKFKQRCKLLTVVLQKVYAKILNQKEKTKTKLPFNKENTTSLLHNTSPITRVFNSNLYNNTISPSVAKQNQNQTLQTLAQLDINIQDLQKYSQGLEMFGVDPSQFKTLQNQLYNAHNQTSTFSQFMNSPQTAKNYPVYNKHAEFGSMSPSKDFKGLISGDVKQKVQRFSDCLSDRSQIDVGQILTFFDQLIEESI